VRFHVLEDGSGSRPRITTFDGQQVETTLWPVMDVDVGFRSIAP